jgi:hypothetical protein
MKGLRFKSVWQSAATYLDVRALNHPSRGIVATRVPKHQAQLRHHRKVGIANRSPESPGSLDHNRKPHRGGPGQRNDLEINDR